MTQRSQWGATGLQVPWPKATRVELMVSQYWGGSFSPDVHDPVHMGVHADRRFFEGHRHHEVGGFSPHPGQPDEGFDLVGDLVAKLAGQHVGQPGEESGFVLVKAHREDQLGNALFAECCQPGQVRCFLK